MSESGKIQIRIEMQDQERKYYMDVQTSKSYTSTNVCQSTNYLWAF